MVTEMGCGQRGGGGDFFINLAQRTRHSTYILQNGNAFSLVCPCVEYQWDQSTEEKDT